MEKSENHNGQATQENEESMKTRLEEEEEEDENEEELVQEWNSIFQERYPVFITVLFFLQYWSYVLVTELGLFEAYTDTLVFTSDKWYQPWRYFTVVFIHRNLNHLTGNMMKQLQFGILLEIQYGWRRTCVVYFVGAACGTMFHHVCFSEAGGISSGASSATKALLFANLASIIINWRQHFKYHGNVVSTLLQIISNCGLVLYSLFGLTLELIFFLKTYHFLFYQEHEAFPRQAVSHAAHLGGAIGGLIVGALLFSSRSTSTLSPSSLNDENNATDSQSYCNEQGKDLHQDVIPLITLVSALVATFG